MFDSFADRIIVACAGAATQIATQMEIIACVSVGVAVGMLE